MYVLCEHFFSAALLVVRLVRISVIVSDNAFMSDKTSVREPVLRRPKTVAVWSEDLVGKNGRARRTKGENCHKKALDNLHGNQYNALFCGLPGGRRDVVVRE